MPFHLPARAASVARLGAGLGAAAILAAGLSGCTPPAADDRDVVVTVFAAASLATAFEDLSFEFERQHPEIDVVLSVGGSNQLAAQLVEGAPAQVFAAASTATMTSVVDAGLTASRPEVFARNAPMIAVAPGNPLGVRGLADLADGSPLTVVACAPAVPCGAVAGAAARAAGLTLALASEELNVIDVLAKVTAGEADAGVVYRTDVAAAGPRVTGVPIAESAGARTDYPIVALATDPDAPAARAATLWIGFVTGPEGRRTLERLGFETP